MVECRTCNPEVAGSNLGQGYFAPRSSQPSIPLRSVNEYQLRLGKQRQVYLILLADETQGVQVKLCYPLTMRAIPERLKRCFTWRRYNTNRLPLPFTVHWIILLFVSSEMKEEEDEFSADVKKRVPLSLEELLAKKKAEEEAQSKVRGNLNYRSRFCF